MATPTKLNLKIYQGSTFSQVLRWESSVKAYKTISAITKAAPMVVTCESHTIPPGWRVKLSGVLGMKEVNTDEYIIATGVSSTSLSFNDVNSSNYAAYTSGGVVEYNIPNDLTDFSARMQIRGKITDATPILELTSAGGGIVLDNTLKTITINITAAATELLTFKSGVYSLEVVNAGTVITLAFGNVTLNTEITR